MRTAQAFDVIVDALKLWWQDWVNQVVVSLAAILLSLTVVLAPAAMFGIYQECKDLTHQTRTGLLGFWQGFRSYFRQNLTWGLVNLVIILVLVTNTWFYYKSQFSFAPILTFLMIGLGAFWIIWQSFTLACFYLQEEKTLKLAWKNGLAIMLGNLLCPHHRSDDAGDPGSVLQRVHPCFWAACPLLALLSSGLFRQRCRQLKATLKRKK